MGHAYVHRLAAEFFEKLDAFFDFVADAAVKAFGEIVARDANAHPFYRFRDFVGVSRNRRGGGSGIVGVASGNGLQNGGNIFHIVGKRADTIERGSERDQAVARNAAVAAHHRGNAAERSGLADGASGIGAERGDGQPRGNRGSGSSAGATGNAVHRMRIFHRAVGGVFIGAAHGEFVAICFAEDYRACLFQALDRSSVVGRDIVFENF